MVVVTASAMEYLENIGSYLPDLSPAVQSVWQGWQQVTQIDSLYLAVAGEQSRSVSTHMLSTYNVYSCIFLPS